MNKHSPTKEINHQLDTCMTRPERRVDPNPMYDDQYQGARAKKSNQCPLTSQVGAGSITKL